MYALLGIDTVIRIVLAMLFLFVFVPWLAFGRRVPFWISFAAGTIFLTLIGQLLTLVNAYSTFTLLLVLTAFVVIVRARVMKISPATLLRNAYRIVVLAAINILEGRVNVARRFRRAWRRRPQLRFTPRAAGWTALIAVAAGTRLYRPFATANLGFSDTYVHLYLMRLLEQGRQVDPAWGPYPRGMHFLLLAIHELTNADFILLMNFFGAIVGVLLAISVADCARRLTNSFAAGILAGLLFATMIGGASQYFLLGGSYVTDNIETARATSQFPYEQIQAGEFDILLTSFQRQSATLPQELAIVFLFPGALFLLEYLGSGGRRPPLLGYAACTAAIAAVHPGVIVPLVMLSGVAVIAARAALREIGRVIATGAIATLISSSWMLGYIMYSNVAQKHAGGTALYYFPLLRRSAELQKIRTWVDLTPFLIATVILAIVIVFASRRRTGPLFIALSFLVFFAAHVASRFHLPELVEIRRNAEWFSMTMCLLIAAAIAFAPRAKPAIASAVLLVWFVRIPSLGAMRNQLLEYSGYGTTAFAVLQIERKLEPFTWTLVSYGQEFPMVLGKGFHLAAADFLDRYDPGDSQLRIPTRFVFIAVEKTPHRFQIDNWAAQFSRSNLEQRLQTWCFLYQMSHRDMRVFVDDEHVRVYVIERSDSALKQAAMEARP
ncbi:MAG TPA: hypothetical protein VMU84_01275 [Thermoanaerobaculia bacterium]|nr:hypothetical protein [Thermoanaerobaculia bacterium]